MKATTNPYKGVFCFFALAIGLGLALPAALPPRGARPAAARPAFLDVTPSPMLATVTPVLEITKVSEGKLVFDANNDQKLDPGDKVRYVISYQNTGSVGATSVTVVDDYDQTLVSVDSGQISAGGTDDGDKITWVIGDIPPDGSGQVTYVVTVIAILNPGTYTLKNIAKIQSGEVVKVGTPVTVTLVVPIPTETAEFTPSPAPTGTITPTITLAPTSPPPVTGVGAVNLQDSQILWPLAMLTLILELGGIFVLGLVATKSKLGEEELSRVIRVGFVVTLTVGAVLIMGVFGGIERGAAAGILGTIAGYLLRGIKES